MCGRYSLTTPVEGLRQLFGFPEQPNLEPRYNIAPTQEVAAVRAAPPAGATEGAAGQTEGDTGESGAGRHLVSLRWGLIPSWAKDPAIGARMINARAETLAEKPAFKQPYRIARPDGGPFAFAGLWERWRNPTEGRDVESCTIVTTAANATLSPIHHRMPVILAPESYDLWLDPEAEQDRVRGLLAADPGMDLVATAISTRVNKVAHDDPEVILPLDGASDVDAGASGQAKLL
jgi:putative SOS response-associated peptidase YedK